MASAQKRNVSNKVATTSSNMGASPKRASPKKASPKASPTSVRTSALRLLVANVQTLQAYESAEKAKNQLVHCQTENNRLRAQQCHIQQTTQHNNELQGQLARASNDLRNEQDKCTRMKRRNLLQRNQQSQQLQGQIADLQRQDEKNQKEIQHQLGRVEWRDKTIRDLEEKLKRTDRTMGTVNTLHAQINDAATKNATLETQLAKKDQQLFDLHAQLGAVLEFYEGELAEAHQENHAIPAPAATGALLPGGNNGGAAPAVPVHAVQPAILPPPGAAAAPPFPPHPTVRGVAGPPHHPQQLPVLAQHNVGGGYPNAAPPLPTPFPQPAGVHPYIQPPQSAIWDM